MGGVWSPVYVRGLEGFDDAGYCVVGHDGRRDVRNGRAFVLAGEDDRIEVELDLAR